MTSAASPGLGSLAQLGAGPGQRSDSPILEGMDADLAKYAELKDLEKAYTPKSNPTCDSPGPGPGHLRHPDGASNPDLGRLEASHLPPPSASSATLPRRSPGAGRSSSGSDEADAAPQWPSSAAAARSRHQDTVTAGNSAAPPAAAGHGVATQPRLGQCAVVAEDKPGIKDQKEKPPKVPRFSRLFGKKISRSPTQIAAKGAPPGAEPDKPRSKASKRQTKTSEISLKDSGQLKTEKLISDKPTKTKYRFFEKREKCIPKSPVVNVTKNVKGTLSSEQLFDKPKTPKSRNSPLLPRSEKKDKKARVATRSQGVSVVSSCLPSLPSPYSFPSKIKTRRSVNSETSGSGYDSGIGEKYLCEKIFLYVLKNISLCFKKYFFMLKKTF